MAFIHMVSNHPNFIWMDWMAVSGGWRGVRSTLDGLDGPGRKFSKWRSTHWMIG